jgi:hypothetical protein
MKKEILFIYSVILALAIIFSYQESRAQQFDCKGKDFWFTFIPNYHNHRNANDPALKYGDSLYIYIASEKPASGEVTFRNIFGNQFVRSFSITDTNKIFTIAMSYYDIELLGYNNSGLNWSQNQCENIARQSFHLTSDVDVSVYALNQANTTSDAFFVFPTDILGEDYLIMAYNSDGTTFDSKDRTPSQFAIVATEDSTIVDIKASVPTYIHRTNKSWSVTLNRGDVYLVQSAFDLGIDNPDLTGSEVLSNKPIAVFGGQQRAKLPVSQGSMGPSRDILVEQLQPLKNWGKNAYIVPFYQPYDITPFGKDIFRVLASKDSTALFFNNNYALTLNKGQIFEAAADKPIIITANNPISVAQYKKTSKFYNSDLNVSDPFMLIIPPKEQYQSTYRVINAQSWDINSGSLRPFKTFTEQYITLIVPDTSISSIRIDNVNPAASRYRPIPGSGFSYLNYSTLDGVHSISSNAPIGVYVYGYGDANSYGYLGGMNFIPLNFKSPRIVGDDTCLSFIGRIEKYSRTDYGVWEANIKSSNNVKVDISPFSQPSDTVWFTAQLINPSIDGDFTIATKDSLGNSNEKSYSIPGFTVGLDFVRIPQSGIPDTVPVRYDTIRARSIHQSLFNLLNYGSIAKSIVSITHLNQDVKLLNTFPKLIASKGLLRVTYQIYSESDTTIIDTLYISDGCIEKPLLILNYRIIGDKKKPDIQFFRNPCDTLIEVVITDSTNTDFGIEKIEITNSVNCSVEYVMYSNIIAKLRITPIRKSEDAIISLVASDSSGNSIAFSDTITGHNLVILSISDTSNIFSFGRRTIGSLTCDSVQFHNRGIPDIVISEIKLARNLEFDVPTNQLPLVIPGGESKSLFVCFKPNIYDRKYLRDTMSFIFNCIEEKIIIEGIGDKLMMDGESICDIDLVLVSRKVPVNFFINDIYPNPISDKLNLILSIPEHSEIYIQFFDYFGRKLLNSGYNKFNPGIFNLTFDIESFPNGKYIIVVSNGKKSTTKWFIKAD